MAAVTNTPVSGVTASITTTATTDVVAAPGASKSNYIRSVMVTNASQTVGTYVKIVDETSGAILCRGWAGPNGGFTYYPKPWVKQGATNKKVQVICETNGADVTVNVQGFKNA